MPIAESNTRPRFDHDITASLAQSDRRIPRNCADFVVFATTTTKLRDGKIRSWGAGRDIRPVPPDFELRGNREISLRLSVNTQSIEETAHEILRIVAILRLCPIREGDNLALSASTYILESCADACSNVPGRAARAATGVRPEVFRRCLTNCMSASLPRIRACGGTDRDRYARHLCAIVSIPPKPALPCVHTVVWCELSSRKSPPALVPDPLHSVTYSLESSRIPTQLQNAVPTSPSSTRRPPGSSSTSRERRRLGEVAVVRPPG